MTNCTIEAAILTIKGRFQHHEARVAGEKALGAFIGTGKLIAILDDMASRGLLTVTDQYVGRHHVGLWFEVTKK